MCTIICSTIIYYTIYYIIYSTYYMLYYSEEIGRRGGGGEDREGRGGGRSRGGRDGGREGWREGGRQRGEDNGQFMGNPSLLSAVAWGTVLRCMTALCYRSVDRWCCLIAKSRLPALDSLRGSSVNIGTIQRILAWPLRKDDTHTSRSVDNKVQAAGQVVKGAKILLTEIAQVARDVVCLCI